MVGGYCFCLHEYHQSMVAAGRHDPVKRRNDVANFKTGTRVKRLQRAGALRPLVGDFLWRYFINFLNRRQEGIPRKHFM